MPAGKDEPSSGDRRSHMRYPIAFRAIVHWSNHYAFVQVADIANGGLRVIGDFLPGMGSHVRIGARSLDAEGQVIWRTPHSCGLMLSQAVDALRVVRANCRPGIQQAIADGPLQEIGSADLAGSITSLFGNAERARDFVQAYTRH